MKLCTIVKKEYRDIVKKKTFIISTILTPILMGAFMFLPLVISKMGRGEKNIHIADFSGTIAPQVIEMSRESGKNVLSFTTVDPAGRDPDDLVKVYNQKILKKEVDALLYIPREVKKERKIYFYALNISDFETNEFISNTVQHVVSKQVLTEKNIDPQLVDEATRGINLETFKVKKAGATRSSSGMDYFMSIFMLTILFSIIMGYGQLLMRGVIEEKNNRIVEVLISSTTTQNLFYGKIIGIGLAGLTQVGIWILLGAIFITQISSKISQTLVTFLTFEVAVYFVIYFIIGYFMYSILFSIVGASVNTDQEAQQFATPIFALLFIPFMIGIAVTQNPNTPFVIIASLFPLFSPTLMFMRISVAVPAFSQILLSILLSVGSTIFLAWLGAKIFRVGILMYGKKPSVAEITRWVKYR